MIKFMLITNDPEIAVHAESCGVGRIFVDLERLGKEERQGHLDTFMSKHSMSDVAKIKSSLIQAELLVRLNPLNKSSKDEIDAAIAGGADLLMLPMFACADEVKEFARLVDGRVGVIPLVETYDAAMALGEVLQIPGVTEIYIGLNDLYLDMKLSFMFEPLANGLVDELAQTIKQAGLPFGFGGIARVGEGIIPGELVLGEHLRLGSSSVILSRTFHRKSEGASEFKANLNLKGELESLLEEGRKLQLRNENEIMVDHKRFKTAVTQFVASKKK